MPLQANVRTLRPPSSATPPPGSPPRAALRQAIAERARHAEKREAARASAKRAADMAATAEAALSLATEQVERAKQEQARSMADAARTGVTFTTDASVREARSRQQQCQDDLDAANAALAAIEASMLHDHCERLGRECAEAADRVMLAEAAHLLAEAEALQQRLISRRVVLRYFMRDLGGDDLAGREFGKGDELLRRVRSFLRDIELPSTFGVVERIDWNRHPAAAPWRFAREELLRNADAPLPASDE
jgi:hypothetical protein